ncbi:crotonase-like domain-containing [Lecanosticta acicola]|uniref:Crotonase-like domain-containing n=1 Tax=Lecanosticta acicola TaxID=111012 RepID=A0AAI8YSL1_9PEZI|nr:crotonase-like domain-containing [Lecanosticta acicola]
MPLPPKLTNIAIDIDSEAIAIVKFNRPKNANSLNTPVLKDLLAALRWAEAEDAIRIIVTTGEGKFYTAGLDLMEASREQEGTVISDEFCDTLSAIHESLIQTNKLVISAVNGPAPGWGTTSLTLSDLVYATPDSVFFTPFVQWGLCAEGCSSTTFLRIMGRQKASALILAGSRMTAHDLDAMGLVTKILPQEGFLDGVLEIARGTARLPKQSLQVNKALMMRTSRAELLETNRVEMEALRKQARGEESRKAIGAYVAETERKRKEKAAKM